MVVGAARITLALGQSRSLKDKRQIVRKIVDRVRARFQVAISEVDDLDLWQKATLGIAAVGGEAHHVRAVIDEVVRAIDALYLAPIVACDVQVETYNDFETAPFEAGANKGPNPFTRELLAGEGADDPPEEEPEDAPWAEPEPPKARR